MRKKFLTNLALLLFLNLLIKPFWIFGIDRTVQNVVGVEDYGFYFTIFNFAFLFNILLDAGITNFNNRNIAQHQHLLNKHFSSIIILKFLLAIGYVIITYAVALIIGYKGKQLELLAWIALNQFLLSFILYLRSNISGLLMFRTDSLMSVLDRILMIIFCGILLWGNFIGGKFKIEWFVYTQTLAYAITFFTALIIVVRKARFRKLKWNWPFFLVILKQSLPFAILILLMSVYNRVDSVFIERLLRGKEGYEQVGFYAQAYRLLDAANQFAWLFAVLLLPIYSKMIRQKQPVEEMVRLPFSIMITGAVILVAGSFFYRAEIMNLLYAGSAASTIAGTSTHLTESAEIYGILMFSFIGSCTMYVFSTLLTANGNLKQLNLVALCGIVINFGLNLLLIPSFKALGSAYASLTTQIVTALSYVLLVQYYFRFRINYRFLLKILIFSAGVILFNLLSRLLGQHWVVNFSIMIIVSFALAILLKMISIRSLLSILKEKGE